MKIVSFEVDGQARFGVVREAGIVDLTGKLGAGIHSLRDALAHGALEGVGESVHGASPDFSLDEVKFLPPIPFPEKIICVGVNYGHRNEEYKDGSAAPRFPSVFPRFPGSFVGHASPLLRPPESEQLDYEGEIAIVIGKGGARLKDIGSKARQQMEHLFGRKVFLETWVRVREGWSDDETALKAFGYE